MTTTTATVRHWLLGVLSATALGGTVTAVLAVPSATATADPCAASQLAKTVSFVAKSTGDYLDSHPETNLAMTTVLQQPAGLQSVASLKSYFEANPKAATDLQTISQPLTGLSAQCKLPISIPQVLGFMQAAQGQAGLPGGLPGMPGDAAAAARPVPGTQGSAPAGNAPVAAAPKATPPAASGPATAPPQTAAGSLSALP